jgi:hypothetical protein
MSSTPERIVVRNTTTQPDPRPFGLSVGAFTVPADFDAPLPEELLGTGLA